MGPPISDLDSQKGGGFYGYKLHAAICARTDLPVAWHVSTAKDGESGYVSGLLDLTQSRGFNVETCALDKGYDNGPVYDTCEQRGIRPIFPLRQTPAVKRGDHNPPTCQHGTWTFAGSDAKRGASKWRCPTGYCTPASTWSKADRLHPLVPRETARWSKLYRRRASVEREFERLKHEWGLTPLRVRRVERVRLHADLTILTRLACALGRTRTAVRLAA